MELLDNMIFRKLMEYNRTHELRADVLYVGEESYRIILRCYQCDLGKPQNDTSEDIYVFDCKLILNPKLDINAITPGKL